MKPLPAGTARCPSCRVSVKLPELLPVRLRVDTSPDADGATKTMAELLAEDTKERDAELKSEVKDEKSTEQQRDAADDDDDDEGDANVIGSMDTTARTEAVGEARPSPTASPLPRQPLSHRILPLIRLIATLISGKLMRCGGRGAAAHTVHSAGSGRARPAQSGAGLVVAHAVPIGHLIGGITQVADAENVRFGLEEPSSHESLDCLESAI